jgi:hypothetical protein
MTDLKVISEDGGGSNGGEVVPLLELTTGAEILALELPEEHNLVENLIPDGAVGVIAGLPETHKSFLAQEIAVKVAAGAGEVLGCAVERSVPVAYLWQDDSTRAEIERIQLYARTHPELNHDLPLWSLNRNIKLPRDIESIRATAEHLDLGLLILDSFYNFVDFGLREADAEKLVGLLKAEVSDRTGTTVLIVDHMPWPTDANRGRLRTYGGVFKSAATRFGIYLDVEKKKLWIEARGNNITGFKRRLAEWSHEKLEIQLVETAPADETSDEEYEQQILNHLREYGEVKTEELTNLPGRKSRKLAARKRLLGDGRIEVRKDMRPHRWSLSNLLKLEVPETPEPPGTSWDETAPLSGLRGSGTRTAPDPDPLRFREVPEPRGTPGTSDDETAPLSGLEGSAPLRNPLLEDPSGFARGSEGSGSPSGAIRNTFRSFEPSEPRAPKSSGFEEDDFPF